MMPMSDMMGKGGKQDCRNDGRSLTNRSESIKFVKEICAGDKVARFHRDL